MLGRFPLVVVILALGGTPAPVPAADSAESTVVSGKDAQYDTLRIIEGETVLAAVVQTTGIAARFAPDHLIEASEYELVLVLDPDRPEDAVFSGRIAVASLVVNDPELQNQLAERMVELGIRDGPWDEMSEDDRRSVRQSMLDDGQLDAAEHPWIEVEAVQVEPAEDGDDFPWVVLGALTVRDTRVERPLRARLDRTGPAVQIEAFGAFDFTDFGIEPYSAFLGAVRNRDEFHLYLRMTAESSGVPDARSAHGPQDRSR